MSVEEVPVATNSQTARERHQDNRQAWNEAALEYRMRLQGGFQALSAGTSNLHPIERRNLDRFGPLGSWCKRAIHLQCASGEDTLSLLLEGARDVVGVDISEIHIENARSISANLNMTASWYCCDVLDTPGELDGTADLVYTGRGAINWLHDLQAWANVVARLLKPGGILHLLEEHPASWLFDQDSEELVASGVNYFQFAEASRGWPSTYLGEKSSALGPDGKPVSEQRVKYERLWTVADVFQALVGAGLNVVYLGEHPDEYWRAFPNLKPESRERIPMTFSIVAKRDGT
jgi:SAM-dependent methyltransferase